MNLYVLRTRLASALVRSQHDARADDPVARSFALGRLNGLEEAIRLVDEALREQREAEARAPGDPKPGEDQERTGTVKYVPR